MSFMLVSRRLIDSTTSDASLPVLPVSRGRTGNQDFQAPSRDSVSLLRVIVCLSVIGMHFFPPSLAKWPNDGWLLPSPQWLVAHARFGFESFFILSGFFLVHSFRPNSSQYFSALAFLRRRLTRLAIPYWVALVVLGAGWYELGAAIRGIEPFTRFSDVIPAIFFVQDLAQTSSASYALWFMAPLMQFNVLWIAAFWLVRRKYLRDGTPDYQQATLGKMIVLAAVSFISSVLITAIWGHSRWQLATNAHYLILGSLICWTCAGKVRHQWAWVAIAIEIALAAWRADSHPAAAAITSGLLLALSGRWFIATSWLSPLKFVGQRTYSIYLTHIFIGNRVINLLAVLLGGASTAGRAMIVWGGAIVASVAFGVVFYEFVEEPAIRLARRVKYRD